MPKTMTKPATRTAKPGTRVVTASLPIALAEKVDAIAAQMERPRGWIMKQALNDWVDWEEEKHRRTLEGLASVDAGRTVPHAEVVKWANSLGTDKPLPKPAPKCK
ncbi:MAG: ribbon-helix-helix protein, CopG family [Nitrosospira sp.]|nr:ribbon-helix-helix protein, CopG family [Nitrosospira sp.]